MKLVWFSRNDGSLYANSSAGAYGIRFDDEQGVYVLSRGEMHLFETPSLEEAKSRAEEFVDLLLAAKRRIWELLRLKTGSPQRATRPRRGSADEALTDEELNYDPDIEAMLEGYSRRIDEVRVEETTD